MSNLISYDLWGRFSKGPGFDPRLGQWKLFSSLLYWYQGQFRITGLFTMALLVDAGLWGPCPLVLVLCSTKNSIEKSIEISIFLLNCPPGVGPVHGHHLRRVRVLSRVGGIRLDFGAHPNHCDSTLPILPPLQIFKVCVWWILLPHSLYTCGKAIHACQWFTLWRYEGGLVATFCDIKAYKCFISVSFDPLNSNLLMPSNLPSL